MQKKKQIIQHKKKNGKLSEIESEIDNYYTRAGENTVTISESQYQELSKAEKVELISNTALNYSNQTLSYDFSKYKRVRCYSQGATNCNYIFEIDLTNLNNGYYNGVGIGHTNNPIESVSKGYIFTTDVLINPEKNLLTMTGIGFINSGTYNDRFTSNYTNAYCIYKIEGIY